MMRRQGARRVEMIEIARASYLQQDMAPSRSLSNFELRSYFPLDLTGAACSYTDVLAIPSRFRPPR